MISIKREKIEIVKLEDNKFVCKNSFDIKVEQKKRNLYVRIMELKKIVKNEPNAI